MHQPTALDASLPGGWNQRIPDQQVVSSLRGPVVEVDARRVARVAVALCLVGLTVTAALLLVAGFEKNAQTARLEAHGVETPVTVSACQGMLGGSGSNQAGYACSGRYAFGGRHFDEAIPGNTLMRVGTRVTGVVDPQDPALLSTPAQLADEGVSGTFLIVPLLLVAVVVASCVLIATRRRSLSGSDR